MKVLSGLMLVLSLMSCGTDGKKSNPPTPTSLTQKSSWIFEENSYWGRALNFENGNYQSMYINIVSSTTILVEMSTGTVKDTGQSLIYTPTKSTCKDVKLLGYTQAVLGVTRSVEYKQFNSDNLTIYYDEGITSYLANKATPNNNIQIIYVCFSDDFEYYVESSLK